MSPLGQHQRETLARKLLSDGGTIGGGEFGSAEVFDLHVVGKPLDLHPDFLQAVKNGEVDFSDVPGYGKDVSSSSSSDGIASSLSSMANAATLYFQNQAQTPVSLQPTTAGPGEPNDPFPQQEPKTPHGILGSTERAAFEVIKSGSSHKDTKEARFETFCSLVSQGKVAVLDPEAPGHTKWLTASKAAAEYMKAGEKRAAAEVVVQAAGGKENDVFSPAKKQWAF